MSNYTGPVVVIPFIGVSGKTEFALTLHVAVDDPVALKRIVDRYEEDGYKADLKHLRRHFMSNGTLEDREPKLGPIGFRRRSAFIRA